MKPILQEVLDGYNTQKAESKDLKDEIARCGASRNGPNGPNCRKGRKGCHVSVFVVLALIFKLTFNWCSNVLNGLWIDNEMNWKLPRCLKHIETSYCFACAPFPDLFTLAAAFPGQ